ncbi:hypothetical protein COCMIDRAFT_26128 [Bipolaris oryzae ATCC 44560]|uniref:Uncharacterized protein n=1 Tax=Bipolaris oryzae ATCC 44560 TaxID=930090 RepID=W6ZQ41_COCMI|nr:uncharacterized protein COCMIDRAFT_26128 [Bipolaris oryzae ATCC 44560]EUC45771.1 hypothetical protein COCMIDRAFT_26128 [Bipolaris oryzae ATCC 44560]
MRAPAPALDGMGDILKSAISHTAETPISSFDSRNLSSFPSSVDDDSDPSDSLLVLAPLYIPESGNDEAAAQERPGFTTKRYNPDESSRTWRDWLITLFAGRKPTLSSHNHHKRTDSFIYNSAGTQSASQPLKPSKKQDATTAPTQKPALKHTAPCNHAPRLLLSTVIPSVCTPKSHLVTHCLSYTKISPAPLTAYTGYAVVARDDYPPERVIRGFDVPDRPALTAPSSRRNNTAANLLDRDRDAWPSWNRNITSPADLPFGKTHPGRVWISRQAGMNSRGKTGKCGGDWSNCQDASRCSSIGVEEWPFSQYCYW